VGLRHQVEQPEWEVYKRVYFLPPGEHTKWSVYIQSWECRVHSTPKEGWCPWVSAPCPPSPSSQELASAQFIAGRAQTLSLTSSEAFCCTLLEGVLFRGQMPAPHGVGVLCRMLKCSTKVSWEHLRAEEQAWGKRGSTDQGVYSVSPSKARVVIRIPLPRKGDKELVKPQPGPLGVPTPLRGLQRAVSLGLLAPSCLGGLKLSTSL
jgi:hypothetical protein